MTDYTDELNRLLKTEEAFRHAAFQWNQLDDERKKNDLLKVFGHSAAIRSYNDHPLFDELIVSRLISEDYISWQSLLLIPDLAIEVALTAQEEVAAWVRSAFCQKDVYKKLERSYIVSQIYSVVADDSYDLVYINGWDMLYRMGFKKELLAFMERYKKELELDLDEDDRQDIMDMTDGEDLT